MTKKQGRVEKLASQRSTERVSQVEVRTGSDPSTPVPSVPRGYKPLDNAAVRKLKMLVADQRRDAGAMARELRASRSWTEDLGTRAPTAQELSDALDRAAKLRAQATHAANRAKYVGDQSLLAEDTAARLLEKLAKPWGAAVSDESAVAERYPATATVLGAHHTIAQRGAATRRAQKAAKKGSP